MIRNILFDFDGVISDSMHIRDNGFRAALQGHDEELVEEFMRFHRINGGLSRYFKFRYFYEEMLGEPITDDMISSMAAAFSEVMEKELVDPSIIIQETVDFLETIYQDHNLHVVSGSDGKELKHLCEALDLDKYFITVEGSPTPKNQLVADILEKYEYQLEETIVIGDTINDYEAADTNNIGFYGYNNPELSSKGMGYIETFTQVPFEMVAHTAAKV